MALIINNGNASYKSDLEGLFETLQEHRSGLLKMVREVQLAARAQAVAEAHRLAAVATPDDPRVTRLRDAAEVAVRRAAALEVEVQIADLRIPAAGAGTVLRGRVTNDARDGLARLKVALVDEKGGAIAGVEPVQTDESGHYTFVLEPAQVEAIGAHRNLKLQVGSDAGHLVPSAVQPFTLATGETAPGETRLQASELDKLRLRT